MMNIRLRLRPGFVLQTLPWYNKANIIDWSIIVKRLLLVLVLILALSGCTVYVEEPPSTESVTPQATVSAPNMEQPDATESVTPQAMVSAPNMEQPDATEQAPAPVPDKETPIPQAVPEVNRVKHGYEAQHVQMDAYIPAISGLQDTGLQDYVNQFIYDDVEAVGMDMSDAAQETGVDHFVEADFIVGRNDGTLLSLREQVVYYEKDSATNIYSLYYTILNTKPGVELSLKDLFLPSANYIDFINGEIDDIIKNDPDTYVDNFKTISPDQHFYLTDSELVIVFDKYEIAAGAAGEPEFKIPFKNLPDIFNSWLM